MGVRRDRRPSAPRWLLLVFFGTLIAAVGWSLLAPRSAGSKGPVVRAPAELQPRDCEPGSRPRLGTGPRMERFYRDVELLVIGCTSLASGRKVLFAVEPWAIGWPRTDRLVCFYAVVEGRWDADPRCPEVDADCCPGLKRPLLGDPGVSVLSAVRPARRGPLYVTGQMSAGIASVAATYRMPWGETRKSEAGVVPASPSIARRIGVAAAFAHFAVEIPAGADTCRGVAIAGRDGEGRIVDRKAVERFARVYPSAPLALPGTTSCRGRDPLRDAIAEIVWLPLSGWRSVPLMSPVHVAEVLRVKRSALGRLTGTGLLPVTGLGQQTWYRTLYVEVLCAMRGGCEL